MAASLALFVAGACSGGCAAAQPILTQPNLHLVPGVPVQADLDGDGAPESVLLDVTDGSLSIEDSQVHYRSRDRWQVVQALLGDADQNGLPEVVALLDSEKGRHLGLFAFFGGEYRERLVTQTIYPAPVSLEMQGDLVVLVQESPAGAASPYVRTLLRWNGFGFTRV